MAPKKPKVVGMTYEGHAFISGTRDQPTPDQEASTGSSTAEQEARAVVAVLEALQGLDASAVQRVLTVVVEEYNAGRG